MTAPTASHVASGWFVLRAPLLPFPADGGGTDLAEALSRPEVSEALLLSSPALVRRLGPGGTVTGDERRQRSARQSLTRYLLRLQGRPVPFGLSATCTLGHVGDLTRLEVAPAAQLRRHTRLDHAAAVAIASAVASDPEVRPRLTVRPNPTIVESGTGVRYIEAGHNEDGSPRHDLVEAAGGHPLRTVLAAAAGGASLGDLTVALAGAGHAHAAAARYVDELVSAQLLTLDLEPPLTGPDPLRHIIETLGPIPAAAPTRAALTEVAAAIAAVDAAGPGCDADHYRRVAEVLDSVAPGVGERAVQVDAIRPGVATLGREVVAEIGAGVDLLHEVGRPWRDAGLERFGDAFAERWGERWVPLLEALDEETGIGYLPRSDEAAEPSPLLDGLTWRSDPGAWVRWGPREEALLGLLHRAWADRLTEVELGDADVAALRPGGAGLALPDAFAATCRIGAASPQALAAGDFTVRLDGVAGPSGIRLLARFCHLDPELHRAVADHLAAEEQHRPGAGFAEVVHLPHPRVGNVVHRPVLRRWEIPVTGRSGAPPERTIALGDLEVTVAGGRVRLRARGLDGEVLPRLSNAHDYYGAGNLGIYSFLSALQSQGVAGVLRWSWEPFQGAPFLPRVRRGRVVLSPARWNLGPAEVEEMTRDAAGLDAVRRRLRLPRFVAISADDGELPVDLDDGAAAAAALELGATLVEMFPPPRQLAAAGPEGRYVHDLVVPFHRALPVAAATPLPAEAGPGPRDFPPGSEWLYVKVYCAAATADRLLAGPVSAAVESARGAGALRRWHFVRYSDPRPHLRLRFGGDPDALETTVRPLLEEALRNAIDAGRVGGLARDVYRREVERYGGFAAIEVAEAAFEVDSDAAVGLLAALPRGEGSALRWQAALAGIDTTLQALGLDLGARRRLAERMRAAMEAEFAVDAAIRGAILTRLRPHRAGLIELLAGEDQLLPERIATPLRHRAEALAPLGAALNALADSGELGRPLDEIAWSWSHLWLNRVLRGAHRRHELVLTTFLDRVYDSLAARDRGR